MAVHFAHASSWLFTIPIFKPFLDFVHLLLKCWTQAIHLSLENIRIMGPIYNQCYVHIEVAFTASIFAHIAKCASLHYIAIQLIPRQYFHDTSTMKTGIQAQGIWT